MLVLTRILQFDVAVVEHSFSGMNEILQVGYNVVHTDFDTVYSNFRRQFGVGSRTEREGKHLL